MLRPLMLRRFGWFAAIYAVSLATVGVVAYVLKLVIQGVGLG